MSTRLTLCNRVHALAVAPRRGSKQDVAGGTIIPEDKVMNVDEKSIMGASDSDLSEPADYPTEEDLRTLRKVSDKLPWSAFLVAIIELAERFAYYGLQGPFQNYISKPYKGGTAGVSGALGMGQQAATGLGDFFQFWYVLTRFTFTHPLEQPLTASKGATSRLLLAPLLPTST